MNKTYREHPRIGRVRHSVSYHDGEKTHDDGSPFFDMATFTRRKDKDRFVRQLKKEGYNEK